VFVRGLGSPMAWGMGKRALVRIFYTCKSYLRTFGMICLHSGMDRRESRLLPVVFACMCASKLLFHTIYFSL